MGTTGCPLAKYKSVTELNVRDGALERVIDAKADGICWPMAMVASGSTLWLLNTNSVTELKTSDGTFVRVFK